MAVLAQENPRFLSKNGKIEDLYDFIQNENNKNMNFENGKEEINQYEGDNELFKQKIKNILKSRNQFPMTDIPKKREIPAARYKN